VTKTEAIWGRLLDARANDEQVAIGNYLVSFARELEARNVTCGIDGVKFFALLAARMRTDLLCERLASFEALGDFDRTEIDGYASMIRSGTSAGRFRFGAPSLRGWMLSRGWTQANYDSFKVNYRRFIDHVRRDPRAPDPLRSVNPLFVWLAFLRRTWPQLAACAVVLAMTSDVFDNVEPQFETAGFSYPVELGSGARFIQGDAAGNWWIARPDKSIEWIAPRELRFSVGLAGGAVAGDLTGDGDPEIVLHASAELDAAFFGRVEEGSRLCRDRDACLEVVRSIPNTVRVLTRAGSGWRILASLPTHDGERDDAWCADTLKELLDAWANRQPISDHLRTSRQRCTSHVGAVTIESGGLHLFTESFGRQHLVTHCTKAGCENFKRVLSYDSDVTSGVWVGTRGARRAILATGCWRDPLDGGGPLAYGLIVESPGGGVESFTPLEGRTMVARLNDRSVMTFTGPPCPGDQGHATMVASTSMEPAGPRCAFRIFDFRDGQLVLRRSVDLPCEEDRAFFNATGVVSTGDRIAVLERHDDLSARLWWLSLDGDDDDTATFVDLPVADSPITDPHELGQPSMRDWSCGWQSIAPAQDGVWVSSYDFGTRLYRRLPGR
jgi:hypothetical protein